MYRKIKQYLVVGLGGLCSAVAINTFLVPHHLLSGGVSGLAIISYFLFGLPIGLQIFLMNVPLFYIAYRYVGRDFAIATVYGALMFSAAVDATKFLAGYNLIDDPILASLTGGLVGGLGSGMVFRVNGSLGGLDIVAAVVHKYYSLNFGAVGFTVNFFIMLIAATLFGLKLAVLTLLAMFVSANLTDKVVEGFNRKKTIIIVSDAAEKIADDIIHEVGRGVTYLQGEGAFTRKDKKIIFVVVNITQIAKIKMVVHDIDPCAFMIVQDAYEVMGRGFTF